MSRIALEATSRETQPPVNTMAYTFVQFNPVRIRSYIFRLPLCTRVLIFAIFALWLAGIPLTWLRAWAALIPQEVGLTTSKLFFLMSEIFLCAYSLRHECLVRFK